MQICGIQNHGNTCFVNAALQACAASPSFCVYVQKLYDVIQQHGQLNDVPMSLQIQINFVSTVAGILRRLSQTVASPSTLNIKTLIDSLPSPFTDRRMEHDSNEFIVVLRESIDEVQLHYNKAFPVTVASLIQPPVPLPYLGSINRMCLCGRCRNRTTTSKSGEEFEEISVHIQKGLSLQALLNIDFNTQVEKKCENCSPDSSVSMTKTTSIVVIPDMLIINLNRFVDAGASKKLDLISCERCLQFSLMDGSIATYTHKATISHTGKTRHSGHYVSYIRRISAVKPSEVCYYRVSDANIEDCQEEIIFESAALTGGGPQNETPYVIMYERIAT